MRLSKPAQPVHTEAVFLNVERFVAAPQCRAHSIGSVKRQAACSIMPLPPAAALPFIQRHCVVPTSLCDHTV